ncbi:MAG: nuclear transport factor 2 family protein [Candidatus Marinimicrobia bacterium]|nr:nuclear transport factor 2 family protein [Candidatus Neomarinimicrobiota bacterium]
MSHDAIVDFMRREVSIEEHNEVRELWKSHSMAEDNRDLEGLISTLTEDCVYEMPQTGTRWEGHDGAREFYITLLTAFPDIHFDLQDIVIGPQGVCKEANVTATHLGDWLHFKATGEKLVFKVIIFFPWDPEKKKFRGEKVYLDSVEQFVNKT